MMEDKLQDGFIEIGPGVCPECLGPIAVVDSELTLMELNTEGYAVSEETQIVCKGRCMRCGKEINMMRWQGGYIPYNRSSFILKKMELLERIRERNQSLEKTDKNPFQL